MSASATLTREDAVHFMRVLEPNEHLNVVKMVPMAGNTLMTVASLAGLESFLRPISAGEAAGMSTGMRIHYVDPGVLASWVRDTIGDAELAAGLDDIIASGEAYGILVPEMKQLIAERIAECRAVLDEDGQESEQ
ncbi:MAG: hypothetical protein WBJ62_03260 [Coriobacteriia bacterium]